MTDLCQKLHLFVDGELGETDAENFRHHLTCCDACANGLREAIQLELLADVSLNAPAPRAQKPRLHVLPARVLRAVVPFAAIAATAVLVLHGVERKQPNPEVWFAQVATRPLETRLSYRAADRYRPYDPDRGGGMARHADAIPLGELAELEKKNDWSGIAAACLLRGDIEQAEAFLTHAAASPDRDSDLAAVAFNGNRLEDALILLDGVLLNRPYHPQALWNRGLVLREMGLTLLAAEAFERVAALKEEGWSKEAGTLAVGLRHQAVDRGRAWRSAYEATSKLVDTPSAPLPLEEARRQPGIVRVAFYDAVRAAPTRERARALLPLADELDRVYGGSVLHDYVLRVAARDFARRGPLAQGYALLIRDKKPDAAGFIEQLRRSGEDDLLAGALVYKDLTVSRIDEYAQLASKSGDPWLRILAERDRARRDELDGQWWKSEKRLMAALRTCREGRLAYRCIDLELSLANLYTHLHRVAEAHEHAQNGWIQAREMKEWSFERQFLQELAQIARFQRGLSRARAYFQESIAREPDNCMVQAYAHENLAEIAFLEIKIDDARREMDQALQCGQPLTLYGADMLAEFARFSRAPGDAERLKQALLEFRRSDVSTGELAYADHVEGRFEIERDRLLGQALLKQAIAEAEHRPRTDIPARRARTASYTTLIVDAGKSGEFEEALRLASAEMGDTPVPERCVLMAAVDLERTILVARGNGGEQVGHYDASRRRPLNEDASGVVPQRILDVLRACDHVDVLARPPIHGRAHLLPPDMAWSYRVGRPPGPPALPVERRHLVISSVESPAALKLPRLPAWTSSSEDSGRPVLLTGSDATPSRVLGEMTDATEIEIHAHGLSDPVLSDASLIVLSPDSDGRYALTADEVRQRQFRGAPVVLLATCHAARTAPFLHEPFSLPVAFVEAGAKAVFASTVEIPDSAGKFFGGVRMRIREGAAPTIALRDERQIWLRANPEMTWLTHILLFE